MMLLVVPGIFLLVLFCFAPIFVVLEGEGPIKALKSSWKMVKGRWWSVFGSLLFWLVLSALLMWLINSIFSTGFLSLLNPVMMDQLSQQMNAAGMRGDMVQVRMIMGQIFTQVFQLKFFVGFLFLGLAQTAAAIVPVYGYFSVYKVLRKKK